MNDNKNSFQRSLIELEEDLDKLSELFTELTRSIAILAVEIIVLIIIIMIS